MNILQIAINNLCQKNKIESIKLQRLLDQCLSTPLHPIAKPLRLANEYYLDPLSDEIGLSQTKDGRTTLSSQLMDSLILLINNVSMS